MGKEFTNLTEEDLCDLMCGGPEEGDGMTREEAVRILRKEIECMSHTKCSDCILEKVCDPMSTTPLDSEYIEVFGMAIRALEQEPCEDAISRQALLEAFNLSEKTRKYGGDHSGYDTMMLYEIQDVIEDLPSVTPKQKMGRWINGKCSICGEHAPFWAMASAYYCSDYCPKCGAKMAESEDKE